MEGAAALPLLAFAMGAAGGLHCAAMCGAACAGIAGAAGRPGWRAMAQFQLGRLIGYATAGAAAASAVGSLAWLAGQTAALRPAWVLLHLGVLAWGLSLLALARQPAWVEAAGRAAWRRLGPLARTRPGMLASGALWALMPCGLLYSALLVAALSGGPVQGALSMALFALAGGLPLAFAPRLLALVRRAGDGVRAGWGPRACGAVLAASAAWALWGDLARRVAAWCGLPQV